MPGPESSTVSRTRFPSAPDGDVHSPILIRVFASVVEEDAEEAVQPFRWRSDHRGLPAHADRQGKTAGFRHGREAIGRLPSEHLDVNRLSVRPAPGGVEAYQPEQILDETADLEMDPLDAVRFQLVSRSALLLRCRGMPAHKKKGRRGSTAA
jgi:hypothetical protein